MDSRRRVDMGIFRPVTDADLARARSDPDFRQKLLTESLEILLAHMQRLRGAAPTPSAGGAKQLREGAELAVRLAELLQGANATAGGRGPLS